MLVMKEKDEVLVTMAELIALGLIKEHDGGWKLTEKGVVVADEVMRRLTRREQALCMLRAALVIKER